MQKKNLDKKVDKRSRIIFNYKKTIVSRENAWSRDSHDLQLATVVPWDTTSKVREVRSKLCFFPKKFWDFINNGILMEFFGHKCGETTSISCCGNITLVRSVDSLVVATWNCPFHHKTGFVFAAVLKKTQLKMYFKAPINWWMLCKLKKSCNERYFILALLVLAKVWKVLKTKKSKVNVWGLLYTHPNYLCCVKSKLCINCYY